MPGTSLWSPGGFSRSRGQSSVIGVVLVVAITVIGVTGVMLFGSSALMDSRTQSEVGAAEHALTQLDSRFSLVALGSAERQGASMKLQSGSSMTVDGDAGWMNVSIYNTTSNEVDQVVFNTTLGAIRYENEGTSVAYQGGGVWKRTPSGGSVMVSPPEFHYRKRSGEDPTLTLPLVVVRGNGSVPGEATVTKDATLSKYPNDSDPDLTNPLEGGQINVTVHSEYYEAWGAFFEERTGGTVDYDHDREEVRIVLRIESFDDAVQGGMVSGATSQFEVHKNAEVDSYNSSDGPYSGGGDNNTIVTSGSVKLKQNAKIQGELTAGGSVDIHPSATVTGGYTENADVNSPRAVDWLIDERRMDISSSNNNSDDTDISGNTLATPCLPCDLGEGRYFLDEINLGGGTLELDTSGGDIAIVVDGDMEIDDSKIVVTGGNTVRFYVERDLSPDKSNVTVSGDRAPGLWIYMNPNANVDKFSQGNFTGVVYGPGDGASAGVDFKLSNKIHIFGGLVGNLPGIEQKRHIHYDEALAKEDPLAGYGDDQPTVTYMHVTVNRVNVSSR